MRYAISLNGRVIDVHDVAVWLAADDKRQLGQLSEIERVAELQNRFGCDAEIAPCGDDVAPGHVDDGKGGFAPPQAEAEPLEAIWARIRRQRNTRLANSDWTQHADVPLSDAERKAWADYRRKLRDFPAAIIDPRGEIEWPKAPS